VAEWAVPAFPLQTYYKPSRLYVSHWFQYDVLDLSLVKEQSKVLSLGALAEQFRALSISSFMFVHSSVRQCDCLFAGKKSISTRQTSVKIITDDFYYNLFKRFNFGSNRTKITHTLHDDVRTFMTTLNNSITAVILVTKVTNVLTVSVVNLFTNVTGTTDWLPLLPLLSWALMFLWLLWLSSLLTSPVPLIALLPYLPRLSMLLRLLWLP
jgi:hypothetical protein